MVNKSPVVLYHTKEGLNIAEAKKPGHILGCIDFIRERSNPGLGYMVEKKLHLLFEEITLQRFQFQTSIV